MQVDLFSCLWLHELRVPVFGSLSITSSGYGTCILILLLACLSSPCEQLAAPVGKDVFNVTPVTLAWLCSHMLLGGWECCFIGFTWLGFMDGKQGSMSLWIN